MKQYLMSFMIMTMVAVGSLSAQGMRGGGMGFMFPDTLTQVTLTGKVTLDSTLGMMLYDLDVNGDGKNDYYLNFGPVWYTPDNSTAVRPNTGDQITVVGGQMKSSMNVNGLPMIIVYTVNGNLWRDPYDPMWNNFGMNTHMMGQHAGNCSGYAFGPSGTVPQTVTLTGTVLVDTTYFMTQYYLDQTLDGKPDYYLNLGPWWYESTGGAVRPNNGDNVTIVGGKLQASTGLSVVIVYQINGKVWRDSTLIGKNFGGGWMRRSSTNDRVTNPFDERDFMMMGGGWSAGMGGMMMTDSLFARMIELNPYNIPNGRGEHIFKAYEMGIFTAGGTNGMMQNGGCGGMMNFGAAGTIQFHFDDKQLQAYHIDRSTMRVKYWNDQTNQWTVIPTAVINQTTNTISFSTSQLGSYYILTSDNITAVREDASVPTGFSLDQNYPNPFNPSTVISYTLPEAANVVLKIFDVSGKEITIIERGFKEAGRHVVTLNAANFTSGVYFYQLNAGSYEAVRKLVIMK